MILSVVSFFVLQGHRAALEDSWLRRAKGLPPLSLERIAALERAFALEPGNAETALLIAEQYRWRSWEGEDNYPAEARKAMEWFERAGRLDPYDPLSRIGMGACLDWLEHYAQAEPWFRQALALDPNGCHTRAMMGWHYYQIKEYQACIDWCLKSIATGKTFWAAWMDLASAYAWRGQNAEAAAAVAELLKLRPGYTVQTLVQEGSGTSDNPAFRKEFQRIVEGARKAGLPAP